MNWIWYTSRRMGDAWNLTVCHVGRVGSGRPIHGVTATQTEQAPSTISSTYIRLVIQYKLVPHSLFVLYMRFLGLENFIWHAVNSLIHVTTVYDIYIYIYIYR